MTPKDVSRKEATPRDPLAAQVKALPNEPGVYLFRGSAGEVLYVGKARALRSRVAEYFGAQADPTPRLRSLTRGIRSLETFITSSEAEALLLEWNLIRQHRPRFNIQLRDDKSYPYIKVTVGEPFPRIFVTRRLRADGSRYFGPFTNVRSMRRALRVIKRIYTVRSCHYRMPDELPERPCLDYHIGRCKAPCAGRQSEAEYRAMIEEILEILAGHTSSVRRQVEERMRESSGRLEFERAAELRDVLRGLRALERKQTAVDYRGGDRDVLGLARRRDVACGVVLKVREGRLLGRQVHYLRNVERDEASEVVGALVKAVYLRREELAPELLVPTDFPDRVLVEEYLSVRRDAPFTIRVPARGAKRRLLELARANAAHLLAQERPEADASSPREKARRSSTASGGTSPEPARRLAAALELEEPPRSLLCFDVSTLAGAESAGSAVWLEAGRPRREEYRRFRIRLTDVGQVDDYAMMQEIVGRYFSRRVREGGRLPDLVVVDGGRGQLSAARQGMEACGVSDLPIVALAKREEEIFRPDSRRPVRLDPADPGLHWLQRARDESHRFALRYNRTLRRRRTLRSRLSQIPGVGPAREQALLRRFGSLAAVRAASVEELSCLPGIGPTTAKRIRTALSPAPGERSGLREATAEPRNSRPLKSGGSRAGGR
ncbi:MAG: excinuclease ABC subunit UvrC [Gemmatimonadota bacterium]